ncbi:hypothetical protein ACYOEI_21200, partial [Singulisphaera rosea]
MNAVMSLLALAVIGFEAPPVPRTSGEAFPPFQMAVDVGRSGVVPFEVVETTGTLPPPRKPVSQAWEGRAEWPLTLEEAVRIGLENCEALRVRPRPGDLPAGASPRVGFRGKAV